MPKKEQTNEEMVQEAADDLKSCLMASIKANKAVETAQLVQKKCRNNLLMARQRFTSVANELI